MSTCHRLQPPPLFDDDTRPSLACLADGDRAALSAWLQQRAAGQGVPASPHTLRAYRSEAERFLLWAVLQRGKSLASVDANDCAAYRAFLADPRPREAWCGPRARSRASAQWRPFEGPLSIAARRRAVDVLRRLFADLVAAGQLHCNPWRDAPAVPRAAARASPGAWPELLPAAVALDPHRRLDGRAWDAVMAALQPAARWRAAEPPQPLEDLLQHRLRLGLMLLHATGLRLSELLQARVDDLRRAPAGWLLQVPAHGRTPARQVPVPATVLALLRRHLADRGLPPDPRAATASGAHLLGRLRGAAADPHLGVSASTFHRQAKALFDACARDLRAQGDADTAQQLARASSHWLRHAHAHAALADGAPPRAVAARLGHASPTSIAAYRRSV